MPDKDTKVGSEMMTDLSMFDSISSVSSFKKHIYTKVECVRNVYPFKSKSFCFKFTVPKKTRPSQVWFQKSMSLIQDATGFE